MHAALTIAHLIRPCYAHGKCTAGQGSETAVWSLNTAAADDPEVYSQSSICLVDQLHMLQCALGSMT